MAFKRSVSKTLTTVVEYRLDDHDLIALLQSSGEDVRGQYEVEHEGKDVDLDWPIVVRITRTEEDMSKHNTTDLYLLARAAHQARRGQEYATFRPIAGEGAACARLERADLLMSQDGQYCITSKGADLADELMARIGGKGDDVRDLASAWETAAFDLRADRSPGSTTPPSFDKALELADKIRAMR